jgi:hypothetical protein
MSGKLFDPWEHPTCKRHDYYVVSTALEDVCLIVSCGNCGTWGTVHEPSSEEWQDAFHAPSAPYGWPDHSRVVIRGCLPDRKAVTVTGAVPANRN